VEIKRVLAIDIGFAAAGMAVFDIAPVKLWDTKCIHTSPEAKKRGIYQSHDDVRRALSLTRGIVEYFTESQCSGMAVELPSAAAQGAKANRAMGIATGVIAATVEILRCPVDWITPDESRTAAIGRRSAPKGENIKELVMAAISAHYPEIAGLKLKDKEHIADAIATFEAARDRQMIRTLSCREK
jgi:Holliday junction resolvasome RuvABC endonuclease subunit